MSDVQSSAASSCSEDAATTDAVLQKLGLTDYVDRFHSEQIDLDALVSIHSSLILSFNLPLPMNRHQATSVGGEGNFANVRRIRRQADLNSFPLGELEDAPELRG